MLEIIPNWHPIFVHFTVALLSLAVALSMATPFIRSPLQAQWHTVCLWALWFGAGFTILTALTGLYAYNTVAHDTPSHTAMTDHRNWAVVTISLFLIITVWSIRRVRRKRALGPLFVVAMVFAGSVLASTAWRGGEVVYRYGIGVQSLPQAEGEGHDHEHADGDGHESSAESLNGTGSSVIPAQQQECSSAQDEGTVRSPARTTMAGETVTKSAATAPGHHHDGHDDHGH